MVASEAVRRDVVELLSWAPRGDGRPKACTAMGGDETVYLVGATYDSAIVWVAARADPNRCSDSTNGDFLSRAPLGVTLGATYSRQPVAPAPAPGSCSGYSSGRLGDDRTVAPDGDPEVTVCRNTAAGAPAETALTSQQSRRVVAALRGLAVRTTSGTCVAGDDRDHSRDFRLVLRYPAGPDVVVNVSPDCDPQLMGGGLESVEAAAVVDLVEQWSAPIPGL
jgi:hypothetical protein